MAAVDDLVEALYEGDRLKVLVAAEPVRDPFSRLPRVVEVEHRGHRIDPQPVDVVLVEPEEGVRDEEVRDLVPAVIEYERAPLLLLPFQGVCVLVKGRPVEIGEAVGVLREVGGHPVDDDADARAGGSASTKYMKSSGVPYRLVQEK